MFILIQSAVGAATEGDAETRPSTWPSDSQITQSVEKTLRYDPRVHADAVEVSSEKGVVTLDGFVENLPMKRFVTELTETRKGVRAIVNRLEIIPERLDDKLVQHRVDQALVTSSDSEGQGIIATVSDGVVRLHGKVGSFAMSDLAERQVESIRGVRGIVNELHVHTDEPREDEELRQHLGMALRDDPWIEAGLVMANVENGVVTLSGMIDSLAEKRRLREAVSVPGVREIVEERLVVTAGLQKPSERQAPLTERPATEIENSLKAALMSDPRVRSDRFELAVESGVVSLKGHVDSLAGKRAAVRDASNTPGVSQVYDYLTVKPADPVSDEVLADGLQLAVEADVYLIGSNIAVEAHDGRVILRGSTDTEYQWAHAAKLVSRAPGVKEVENHLRILWPVPEPYLDLIGEAKESQ
ncbi:MAG: BON domain-containing protein [Verrucomicrobiae bacterium]|nr:BON domain-containing protein [Verrucomicrobiae bacterium]